MDNTKKVDPAEQGFTGSLNEPAPATASPAPAPAPAAAPTAKADLIPKDELLAMTRAQIDEYAAEYEIDTTNEATKASAIELLYEEYY